MNEIKVQQDNTEDNNNKLNEIDEKIKINQKELEDITDDLSDNFSCAKTS